MRIPFAPALLSLALSAGAALPASAATSEDGVRTIRVWSDGPGGIQVQERAETPRRQRLAYAAPSETYDDDEARPRRRSYDGDENRRPRATQQRRSRTAKGERRKRTVAKGPRSTRQATAPATPRQRADKPAFTRRSLSQAPGPVGAGAMGIASFYWQPQRVASGGWFNPNAMTAAHKTLPFGTRVRVTHLANGRSVEVKINDRGPYIAGRIIDLSKAAAGVIGMTAQGIARIKMEILGR